MFYSLLNAGQGKEDWGQIADEQGTQPLVKKPAKYKDFQDKYFN